MNGALEVRQILSPDATVSNAFYLAIITTVILSPMLIDSILLTRVLAFYPKRTSSPATRFKVLLFPILVKCGRFIAVVMYLHNFQAQTKSGGSILLVGSETWFENRFLIAEWTLQIVDNTYSSLFFLYKLRLFDAYGRAGWVERHPTTLKRIRGLFYIALGNFVFPIVLNVAQIVLVTTDHSFLNGTYVIVVNNFVSILGVVFATIWTTSTHWAQSNMGSTGSTWNQDEDDRVGTSTSLPKSHGRRFPGVVRLPASHTRFEVSQPSSTDTRSFKANVKRPDANPSSIELESVHTGDDGEFSFKATDLVRPYETYE